MHDGQLGLSGPKDPIPGCLIATIPLKRFNYLNVEKTHTVYPNWSPAISLQEGLLVLDGRV